MDTSELINEAYRKGFKDGLKASLNRDKTCWIRERMDKHHYRYFCAKCGFYSKYRKSNYCPDCGRQANS